MKLTLPYALGVLGLVAFTSATAVWMSKQPVEDTQQLAQPQQPTYNTMRNVIKTHRPVHIKQGIMDFTQPLPVQTIEDLDPFLLLHHHGPRRYEPGQGLPFDAHPHRGFETLTFVLEGDVEHRDSEGFRSVIHAGGIQWMTAGRGILHSEKSSEEFRKTGGGSELIQLWMNLPAKHKMVAPTYQGFEADKIPQVSLNGKGTLHLVAGEYNGVSGPVNSLTGLFAARIELGAGATVLFQIPAGHEVLLYPLNTSAVLSGKEVAARTLPEFEFTDAESTIEVSCKEPLTFLLMHGAPLREPIVAEGPFVMNTEEEIRQARKDYAAGKFGVWDEE